MGGGISEFELCGYYLFIGRVEKIKGIDILLEAFSKMPDKKLVIAGDGPQRQEYQRGVTENIKFLGFVDKTNLAGVLKKAKAVVLPSQVYEGFPMTIAESFSAYKPVIGANIGNVAILIDEDVTGVVFDYDSSDKLMGAIKHFEELDVMKLGENAYSKYKQAYSSEANYQYLLKIYQSCLRGVID